MIPGQSLGMPFIVSPNYIPQDPEFTRHYKPEHQGCPCNGVSIGKPTIYKVTSPIGTHDMDFQYVAVIQTLNHAKIINRSTRNATSKVRISQ